MTIDEALAYAVEALKEMAEFSEAAYPDLLALLNHPPLVHRPPELRKAAHALAQSLEERRVSNLSASATSAPRTLEKPL